ncbi:MAG: hypothetical protein ACM3ML_25585 [Micromonosporaceae bacterium]
MSGRTRTGDLERPASGADGNERLTAIAGAAVFALLAVEGVTIVFLHPLLQVHFFVGMLLVGPVMLKVGSTGYRFVRYYTGAPTYRRKGPPSPILRLLGPVVVASSLAVIGSGVALAFMTPAHGLMVEAHKASFVIWFGAMTIHVLAYIWRVPGLVVSDMGPARGRHARFAAVARSPAGRAARWALLAGALAAGLVIAAATVHLATPWAAVAGHG